MEKCMCMFCVDQRHNAQDNDQSDYTDYSHDNDNNNLSDDSHINPHNYVSFLITIAQFDMLKVEYSYLYRTKNIIEISRDDTHVIGKLRTDSHDRVEMSDYMVLQDITDLNLRGLQNAWFTTGGKILFVPWYGHNLTAALLGHTDSYADELESMGWYHYSIGNWRNPHNVKVTDRMYDAIGKFADQNNQDAALIAFGTKRR